MPGLAGNYSRFFRAGEAPRSYILDDPVIGLAKRAFFGAVGPGSGDLDCRTPPSGRPRRPPCVRYPLWQDPARGIGGHPGGLLWASCGGGRGSARNVPDEAAHVVYHEVVPRICGNMGTGGIRERRRWIWTLR